MLNTDVVGCIAINDRYDYYKIALSRSQKLSLSITAYMRYFMINIYNENGVEIWYTDRNEWNGSVGIQSGSYAIDLTAGIYYVKVSGYRYGTSDPSTGRYILSIN